MKPVFFLQIVLLTLISSVQAQQQDTIPLVNTTTEQQLENLTEATEMETEDDSYLQQYQEFRIHPLNLNAADEADLKDFLFLSSLQVQQLLLYRQQLGRLISLYELQAVPGWDVETIRRLRPYVYVGRVLSVKEDMAQRFANGNHTLLARYSQYLEKQNGFIAKDSTGPKYLGSPQRMVLRYKYQYKNLLQYGVTADKDAGEQWFKERQKQGFDFYSAHLFVRNLGLVKYLALGDFTVNMGQGLVNWQALAFRKSADVMSIKRQADILRPYSSPGEFYFYRGAGITLQKGAWQATGFVSSKKVSANAMVDSFATDGIVSSLQSSGYHRTASELNDKNSINQLSYGGNLTYRKGSLQIGLNAIHHQLSAALQKQDAPYNLFAAGGKSYTNASLDYSYTYKNMHLFGEAAIDKQGDLAIVSGLLASLDAKVDASLLYRRISRGYNSFYTNAFTESTTPVNENGLYMGLTVRPVYGFTVSAYADVFSFPWLRYRVDRPSTGSEYLAQLTWWPDKQTELYTRYTYQDKAINLSNTGLPLHITANRPRQNWRTNMTMQLNRELVVKARAELLWFDKQSAQPETGFLTYAEAYYKPAALPLTGNVRLQYFETDSYDSRLYAYENDVLYSFSIPPAFGKGYRWYLNVNYDATRKLTVWARLAQTYYPDATSIGSGYDEIEGNRRTEIKIQLAYRF
jgi:DNA uptake protein ComE-like DNA-binding protein